MWIEKSADPIGDKKEKFEAIKALMGDRVKLETMNKSFPGIDLHGTLLDGVSFSDLSGSIFKRGKMFRAVMIGSNLSGAVIENMDGTWPQHAINLPIHLRQMLN